MLMSVKRLTVIGCLVAFLATSSLVMASEEGRRNTRNVLGVATGVMALKGNTKAALVGAAATLVAQGQLDKSIRARHERHAYRRGYRAGRRRGAVVYRSYDRGHRVAYRVHRDNGRHLGWYKHGRR